MLCAGSVRQKNVKNIMLKNLLDACGGAIGFWSFGYAFAYGGDDTTEKNFIGTSYFFLNGIEGAGYMGWFFQFAFAATAATIVAGTVAERCKMQAYLCYSLFLTAFVYPVVVRSVWSSNGFLTAFRSDPFRDVGVIDFAGSGVVHMTGKFKCFCWFVEPFFLQTENRLFSLRLTFCFFLLFFPLLIFQEELLLLLPPSFLDPVVDAFTMKMEILWRLPLNSQPTRSLSRFLEPSFCGLDGSDSTPAPPLPLPTKDPLTLPPFAPPLPPLPPPLDVSVPCSPTLSLT